MILEGANKLKEEVDYIIYATNSVAAGQYCVIVPKNPTGTLNMLIDLHHKKMFDEVSAGRQTIDNLTNKLAEEYQVLRKKYQDGLLVVPMINEEEYQSAVKNLDKQKMFDETKKIGAITSELYKKLTESGIDKQKINQKIMLIEKGTEDKEYINWLKEQMPNYVEGVSLEPQVEAATNPITNGNIFGSPTAETVVEPTPKAGGIFDNSPTTSTPEPIPEPIPATLVAEEKIPTPPVANSAEEQNSSVSNGNNIFAPPSNTVEPQKPVETVTTQSPTPEPTVQNLEAPKPVQNIELEGTTTFSPIPNSPQASEENTTEGGEATPKKNGGFVNLAILLAVLVVVTIVSIELGKFLFSVFGAK